MARTVTVSLGAYYENMIQSYIAHGRYNNASEVIRAALRHLEEDEIKLEMLKAALIEGENSGIVENFDPDVFIKKLNARNDG